MEFVKNYVVNENRVFSRVLQPCCLCNYPTVVLAENVPKILNCYHNTQSLSPNQRTCQILFFDSWFNFKQWKQFEEKNTQNLPAFLTSNYLYTVFLDMISSRSNTRNVTCKLSARDVELDYICIDLFWPNFIIAKCRAM